MSQRGRQGRAQARRKQRQAVDSREFGWDLGDPVKVEVKEEWKGGDKLLVQSSQSRQRNLNLTQKERDHRGKTTLLQLMIKKPPFTSISLISCYLMVEI